MGSACSSSSESFSSFLVQLDQWRADRNCQSLELEWTGLTPQHFRRLLLVAKIELQDHQGRAPLTHLRIHNCRFVGEERLGPLLRQFLAVVAPSLDRLELTGNYVSDETFRQVLTEVWQQQQQQSHLSTTLLKPQSPPLPNVLTTLDLSYTTIETPDVWHVVRQFPGLQFLQCNGFFRVADLHNFVQGAFIHPTTTAMTAGENNEHEDATPEDQRRNHNQEDSSSGSAARDGGMRTTTSMTNNNNSDDDNNSTMTTSPLSSQSPPSSLYWPALHSLELEFASFTMGNLEHFVVGLCGLSSRIVSAEWRLPTASSTSSSSSVLSGHRVLSWLLQQQQQELSTKSSYVPPVALQTLSLRGSRGVGVPSLAWLAILLAHQPQMRKLDLGRVPHCFHSWNNTTRHTVRQLLEEEVHAAQLVSAEPTSRQQHQHLRPNQAMMFGATGIGGAQRIVDHRHLLLLMDNDPGTSAMEFVEDFRFHHLKRPFFDCFAHAVAHHPQLKKLSLQASLSNNEMPMTLFQHLESQGHGSGQKDDWNPQEQQQHRPMLHALDVSDNRDLREFAIMQFIASLPHLQLRTVDMKEVLVWRGLTAPQRRKAVRALKSNATLCELKGAPQWLMDYSMPLLPVERHPILAPFITENHKISFLNSILYRNRALLNAKKLFQSIHNNIANLRALQPMGDNAELQSYRCYINRAWPVWLELLATSPSTTVEPDDELHSMFSSSDSDAATTSVCDELQVDIPEQDSIKITTLSQQEPVKPLWVASAYFVVLRSQQWDWIPPMPSTT